MSHMSPLPSTLRSLSLPYISLSLDTLFEPAYLETLLLVYYCGDHVQTPRSCFKSDPYSSASEQGKASEQRISVLFSSAVFQGPEAGRTSRNPDERRRRNRIRQPPSRSDSKFSRSISMDLLRDFPPRIPAPIK